MLEALDQAADKAGRELFEEWKDANTVEEREALHAEWRGLVRLKEVLREQDTID